MKLNRNDAVGAPASSRLTAAVNGRGGFFLACVTHRERSGRIRRWFHRLRPDHAVSRLEAGAPPAQIRRERGSAVVVVLAVLALITVYVVANSRVLFHLKADLKLIEQQQLKKFTPAKR